MTSLNTATERKQITYKVKAKSGKIYTWRFTEFKNEEDYGNGIYIGIETPSGDDYSLDCRYSTNYNFINACADYLTAYYDENLVELWREE